MSTNFPFAKFTSFLGVHSSLLIFTAGWLPRSTLLLTELPPQATSRDKPQHPFLHPLTADPLLTLGWICVGLLITQTAWSSFLKREIEAARRALYGEDEEEKLQRRANSSRSMVGSLKDALTVAFAGAFFAHVILVLFGAPLIHYFSKTYALAFLLSLLTVYTPAYVLRPPTLSSSTPALVHRLTWLRLFVEISPKTEFERALVYPTIGALVGGWVGAIPIALDWDRPWQGWPLTVAYTAITGYLVAAWVALIVNGTYFLAAESVRHTEAVAVEEKSKKEKGKARKRSK